jgi:hypothetical protein
MPGSQNCKSGDVGYMGSGAEDSRKLCQIRLIFLHQGREHQNKEANAENKKPTRAYCVVFSKQL